MTNVDTSEAALELRPAGDRAVMIEFTQKEQIQSLAAAARRYWGTELAEAVAGERTLLLSWRAIRPALQVLATELNELVDAPPITAQCSRHVVVPVRYDGADLDAVAISAGLDRELVIELHAGAQYTVAFVGFAPGFAYLRGGDPRLDVARRSVPRERVPAGSVAIAAGYSTVYPTDSPGGWQILGHTELVMFDPHRTPAALLEPGVQVTFKAI